VCVPIPFDDILNYVIVDNGAPYFAGFAGCDPDSVAAYSIPGLPDGGPYQLTRWRVNGQDLSGNFTDPPDLVRLMKRLDSGQNWVIDIGGSITGGKPWRRYGDLRVVSARGETVTLRPTFRLVPKGTELRFAPGRHMVTFRRIQTGCADTLRVDVACVDCPPIHQYQTGNFDLISFEIKNCRADTVLCTNILRNEWNDYTVTDNGRPVTQFVFCNNRAGIRLDTGYHELRIINRRSTCSYAVKAQVTCPGQIFPDSITIARPDTFFVNQNQLTELPVIANDIIQGGFANPLAIDNMTIVDGPALGQASINFAQRSVLFAPNTDRCGTDRFVYRLRALDRRTDTALVVVNIRCRDLLVFDGFSPNGDGVNDRWQVRGLEQYEGHTVEVFNRWGSLVYRCDRCTEADAWDGTQGGRDLPDAAYFYIINLGNGEKRSGYVHLLR
jgi:gliding motility-associated-like protein